MNNVIKTFVVNKVQSGLIKPPETDLFAIESPVALIYNGISHAVMMATPQDLEHFAIGFSLTENIIKSPKEIYSIDIESVANGIEINIELSSRRFVELKQKRRSLIGRTGCGICGTEQLDQLCPITPRLSFDNQIKWSDFIDSAQYLRQVQLIGGKTGCTHAAVWLDLYGHFIAGFEDIGRHVALDKLLGYRAQQAEQSGVILVSSRASYEMVQKAAVCGVEILLAVSASTSMAIKMAEQYNLTLVSFFRGDKGMVCTHSSRLID